MPLWFLIACNISKAQIGLQQTRHSYKQIKKITGHPAFLRIPSVTGSFLVCESVHQDIVS